MKRFTARSLRKIPSDTREIARLANELASVQTRLVNRIEGLASMEMAARTPTRTFCNDGAHRELVAAVLRVLEAPHNPALDMDERRDVWEALKTAAAPFDPDQFFAEDPADQMA